ncbi:MAG TPA: type 1 glutamine amidotransferase domain-containing protein [Stenomitos sp.]
MADVKKPDLSVQWQAQDLKGKKVAVLVADGFEQSEFDGPVQALRDAGATVDVLAEDEKHLQHIKGVHHFEPGPGTKGTRLLKDASPDEYDLLFVPGGLASPDHMRMSEAHLAFVRAFLQAKKPTAMICHGPWLLADSGMAEGRTVTSWPAIRRDLERAGATWRDEQVVRDSNLVTSRKPDDIPAFSKAVVELLAQVPVAR